MGESISTLAYEYPPGFEVRDESEGIGVGFGGTGVDRWNPRYGFWGSPPIYA